MGDSGDAPKSKYGSQLMPMPVSSPPPQWQVLETFALGSSLKMKHCRWCVWCANLCTRSSYIHENTAKG